MSVAWGMQSEMEFLSLIGTFSREGCDRRAALQGYIDAIPRRRNWGVLDRAVIERYAREKLAGMRS